MEVTGVDIGMYKAHSTRAAATSKTKHMGMSVPEIVQKAAWSNAKTFHRFYNRSDAVQTGRFAQAILG